MAKKAILIRHDGNPPDDRVYTWFATRGFEPVVVRPYAGEALGEPDDEVVGTVLFGGPYNAYDAELHPFLNDEYRWIGACLARGLPILGICQGAHMLAYHLGAEAGPAPHGRFEFGFYELTPTAAGADLFPDPFVVGEKHFHTFSIPKDGVCLAGSADFPNQAFSYGNNVYGLQFHAEVTIEGFRRWQRAPDAPYDRAGAQPRAEQERLMMRHDGAVADWFYGFMDHLFAPASAAVPA